MSIARAAEEKSPKKIARSEMEKLSPIALKLFYGFDCCFLEILLTRRVVGFSTLHQGRPDRVKKLFYCEFPISFDFRFPSRGV